MKANFFNRSLLFLIPLVALIIAGVYMISSDITERGIAFQQFLHGIALTGGIWLGCMAIVSWLWKKYPWEKAPVRHLIVEIILITSYTLAFSFLFSLLEKEYFNIPKAENIGMEIFITILITFLITSIYESVFFFMQWKENFSKSVMLERDNIEARYEALRAQINPHFLFNSLNSLASLVEGNKPVVSYVQNLSELLRYMLKNGEKELVLLREEMAIMNSYILLQQMRFPGTLEIIIDVPENFYHYAVPPLVVQMLVENCLKHNIISKENPLKVEIIASKESLFVRNNLQKKSGVNSTGQGLKNIIGRYRFFTSKEVEIIETKDSFMVIVPLLQFEL